MDSDGLPVNPSPTGADLPRHREVSASPAGRRLVDSLAQHVVWCKDGVAMDVFQFQSFNFPDRFIRHHDFLGELSQEVVGVGKEFEFRLVERGHDAHGRRLVSLGSVFPEHLFLRHRDFRLRLEGPSGTADELFKQDSTFFLEQGLAAPTDPNAVSFRSFNFPDRYIRHRDFHLFVEPRGSANLVADATFIKTVALD